MDTYLIHHGIKGQQWGVRRFQTKSGSLTKAGEKRYNNEMSKANRNRVMASMNEHAAKTGKNKIIKKMNQINANYYNKQANKHENKANRLTESGNKSTPQVVNKDNRGGIRSLAVKSVENAKPTSTRQIVGTGVKGGLRTLGVKVGGSAVTGLASVSAGVAVRTLTGNAEAGKRAMDSMSKAGSSITKVAVTASKVKTAIDVGKPIVNNMLYKSAQKKKQ